MSGVPTLSYKPNTSGVVVDLDRLVASRCLVQANSGGGKSRAIRQLLEETHGRVQHLVIDPEGEFATLRERFDYILAAKQGGDTIAAPKYAKRLCRTLVELNASAVLDLYDLTLDERREFVQHFLTELMALPRSLWHPIIVVIDEMHVFAPEAGSSRAAEAVTALATQGRKRGFCLVGATQRISKLHKDVAAELLNKMIGRTGLDIDVKRAGDELGMGKDERNALKTLAPGEFYVYGPAIANEVAKVKTGAVTTSHPEAGRVGTVPPPPSAKVKAMLAQLADLPKEAEQELRTIEEFKREVASLRSQLTKAQKAQPAPIADQKAIERAVATSAREYASTIQKLRAALEACVNFIIKVTAKDFDGSGINKAELEQAMSSAIAKAMELVDRKVAASANEMSALRAEAQRIADRAKKLSEEAGQPITIDVAVSRATPFVATEASRALARKAVSAPPNGNGHGADGNIGKGERIVLTAIAQYPEGVERDQLTVLTGYKRSTRDAYVQRLQGAGRVQVEGSRILATDEGISALGDSFEPLPTGAALREYWLARLPEGERRVLEVVLTGEGQPVDRDTISEQSGYKRSTRDAYIQRLTSRRVVESAGKNGVRASATLFEES